MDGIHVFSKFVLCVFAYFIGLDDYLLHTNVVKLINITNLTVS